MRLLTFSVDGMARSGALLGDGRVLDLQRAQESSAGMSRSLDEPLTLLDIIRLERLSQARQLIREAERGSEVQRRKLEASNAILALDTLNLLAPITRPSLVLCQGLAYRTHLEEMGVPVPSEPAAFLKAPSSLCGAREPIRLPPDHPQMVDYEGEFAFVIGRPCHRIREEEALSYIAGYTVLNDVSARDWVKEALAPEQSRAQAVQSWDRNIRGKQYPTFTPMGPVLVTADEIADPNNLDLETRVNGQVVQHANTRELIFTVQQLLAHFSHWYSFQPGDVISTGTPAGVGVGRKPPVFLRDGDVVDVAISGIGTLTNPVIRC